MKQEIKDMLDLHQKWLNKEEGGVRLIKPASDFTGTDFTSYSLSKCDIRHSNLTDCIMPWDMRFGTLTTCHGTNVNFSNSCLDYTGIETSNISVFNFIGATWRGQVLTVTPIQWATPKYWVFQTNILARINCKEFTIEEWNNFTNEDRDLFDVGYNLDSNAWWAENAATLNSNAELYAGLI